MAVDTKQMDSGVAVITISGRLALGGETEKLEAAVNRLLAEEVKTFVLDIAGLDYVDSSGVGMMVSCLTKIKKAGGVMKVAGANPRIRRIFSMTGVESMMSLYDNVAAATA
jgi:anti-anti-sigma factor